jgi:pyrroline-5-carboxylate reductase
MGSAIVRGLLAADAPVGALGVADVDEARVQTLCDLDARVRPASLADEATTTILAVKPQQLAAVASLLAPGSRVISIAAGITTARLRELCPQASGVVRVMPNLALAVRRGVTLIALSPLADAELVAVAEELFGFLGSTHQLEEHLFDAGTALSGSGPAWILLVVEALQEAALTLGIPAPLALSLAAETLAGTATLLVERGEDPRALRLAVSSPGGTTAAGTRALEVAGVRAAFIEAVAAAATRARELG